MNVDIPAVLQRATIGRLGAEGHSWLDGIPAQLQSLNERYGITVDGTPFPRARHGFVCPVRASDGRGCVLKLLPTDAEYVNELVAVRHWAGCGAAAQLQAWDDLSRGLLLSRVTPGRPLSDMPDTDVTFRAVADCLRALWEFPGAGCPPPTIPSLTDHVKRLLLLSRQRIRGGAGEGVLDESLVKAAATVAQRLFASPPALRAVLHGNPHNGNLLDGDGPVVAIDPSSAVGDPAFDAATWAVRAHAGRKLSWRAETIAAMTGLDGRRVLAWCRVVALEEAVICLMDKLASGDQCRALVRFITDGQPPDGE